MKQTSAGSTNDAHILTCVGNTDFRTTDLPTRGSTTGISCYLLHYGMPERRDSPQGCSLSYLDLNESFGNEEDPTGSDHQEYCQEEEGREQPEPVKLALREMAAAHEDDILASVLRRELHSGQPDTESLRFTYCGRRVSIRLKRQQGWFNG